MSYKSHAFRKARAEMTKLDALIKRRTATQYQKLRMEQLAAEYGPLPPTAESRQNKPPNAGLSCRPNEEPKA